jgi:hypothetical protein
MTKPEWNDDIRRLLGLIPDNSARKLLLANFADRLAMPRDDFKRRFPGYDTAIIACEDFEEVLAYFCQDLLVDRVGKGNETQVGFDVTIAEVLQSLLKDALADKAEAHHAN